METEGVSGRIPRPRRICISGQYLGVKQNKDYGTWRTVFEIDSEDEDSYELLEKLNNIRKWNSKSQAVVGCEFLSLF